MADNPRIKELFLDKKKPIEKELKRYFKSKDESERKIKQRRDGFIQVYLPLLDSNCSTDKVHYEIFDSGHVQLHLEDSPNYKWTYEFKEELEVALKKLEGIHEVPPPSGHSSWIWLSFLDTNEAIKESDDNIIIKRIEERLDKIISICEETILKYKITTMDKNIGTLKELLKNNHNLILTGAPGTGKTYLAKQIATKMIFVKDKEYNSDVEKDPFFKEHCCFVQFHPSYDYTDFVEGLRPKNDEDGNIGFERKDGVFKEFCKKALKNYQDSEKTPEQLNTEEKFKEAYDKLIDDIQTGTIKEIPLRTPNLKMDVDGITNNGNINLKAHETHSAQKHLVSFARLMTLSKAFKTAKELDQIKNINKSVRDKIGGCNTSAYWGTLHYIYDKYYYENVPLKSGVKKENFIFIIDEINRGDISKIFGELFFSIDPGYRGEKGKVKTQYQNLIEKGDDVFDDGFYVPKNVYIIGTMNDIDRSVESMDFAMRRRFAWKEITVEDQIDMLYSLAEPVEGKFTLTRDEINENVKNKLTNLNNEIANKEYGLSSAYKIGPAYFLNLRNYGGSLDDKCNQLFDNHIRGVLYEYLRGNDNVKDIMKKLEAAFGYKKSN